jgi:hypothetical protein
MRNAATARVRAWRSAALLGLSLLWLGAALPARAADIYRILGIPVDATAESAVAAREIAVAEGEREGLARLMRRLTSPVDHASLPSVAGLPVERFVNSYEVAEEKVGPTRYVATLNVSYVAAEVQAFLRDAGIPFVTRRSDPILVVPVEETPEGPVAWVETSPWRTAWYEALDQATVAVLALPLADLADVAAAPAPALAAGDRAALDALIQRYGTERLVVAQARPERAADTGQLVRVAVTARKADAWDPPLLEQVVEAAPGETEAQTLARAAGLVVAAVEDDWKRGTLVRSSAVSSVVAAVPLADLAGWVQIRSQLAGLPEVRPLQVESLSRTGARVAIGHDGDLGQLVTALERVGLSLAEENDGWHLRPAVGPVGLPVPPSASPPTP